MNKSNSLTSSVDRFDALRKEHPDLIMNLYAMTPRGDVSFEIITPDGQAYTFHGATAAAAMLSAFPLVEAPDEPLPPTPAPSIFD